VLCGTVGVTIERVLRAGPQEAVQEAPDRQRKANPEPKGTDRGAAAAAALRNELSAADVVLGDNCASGGEFWPLDICNCMLFSCN